MAKVDTKSYLMLFLGLFVMVTVINAIFSTTNTGVTTLNSTYTAAGYSTEGNLLITGFKLVILTLGLGMVILGAKKIHDDASRI